ncbi:hypothetical protein KC730_01945, partial [Candidatus Kaiserbacteria bacterium]|nr:hypothetical protein [Candidatus Kaiserbacteria bacterium]
MFSSRNLFLLIITIAVWVAYFVSGANFAMAEVQADDGEVYGNINNRPPPVVDPVIWLEPGREIKIAYNCNLDPDKSTWWHRVENCTWTQTVLITKTGEELQPGGSEPRQWLRIDRVVILIGMVSMVLAMVFLYFEAFAATTAFAAFAAAFTAFAAAFTAFA